MLPLLAAPLISAGLQGLASLPKLIRSPEEKANAKRIKELEAMGDAMGLTPAERAHLTQQYRGAIEGTQRAGERQAAGALANAVGGGSGTSLALAGQARDQQHQLEREAGTAIDQANAARRTELEAELASRHGFQSQARGQRLGAVASIAGAGVSAYTDAKNQAALLGAIGGGKAIPAVPASLTPEVAGAAISSLSPDELERLWEVAIAKGLDTSNLPPPPSRAQIGG